MHAGSIAGTAMLAAALVAPAEAQRRAPGRAHSDASIRSALHSMPSVSDGNMRQGRRWVAGGHAADEWSAYRRLGLANRLARFWRSVGEVGRGPDGCAASDDPGYADLRSESYASVGAAYPLPSGASHGAAWGGSSAPPMVYSPSAAPMPGAHVYSASSYSCGVGGSSGAVIDVPRPATTTTTERTRVPHRRL